jgi:hypothetical protein
VQEPTTAFDGGRVGQPSSGQTITKISCPVAFSQLQLAISAEGDLNLLGSTTGKSAGFSPTKIVIATKSGSAAPCAAKNAGSVWVGASAFNGSAQFSISSSFERYSTAIQTGVLGPHAPAHI